MKQAPISIVVRVAPGMDDNGLGYVVAASHVEVEMPHMRPRRALIPLYVDLDAIEDPDVREAVEAWLG